MHPPEAEPPPPQGGEACAPCEGPSTAPAERLAPTFYASEEDFDDFGRYVSSLAPQCVEYGICKVVPPASWMRQKERADRKMASREQFAIESPIEQHVCGLGGVFDIFNQEKEKRSFEQFKKQVERALLPITSSAAHFVPRAGSCGRDEGGCAFS